MVCTLSVRSLKMVDVLVTLKANITIIGGAEEGGLLWRLPQWPYKRAHYWCWEEDYDAELRLYFRYRLERYYEYCSDFNVSKMVEADRRLTVVSDLSTRKCIIEKLKNRLTMLCPTLPQTTIL